MSNVNWNVAAHIVRGLSDKDTEAFMARSAASDYRRGRLWNEGLLQADRESLTPLGHAVLRILRSPDPWQTASEIIRGESPEVRA